MVNKKIAMDLSTVVAITKPRLREMIGADITLKMNLENEGLWVEADARGIEQVVINLIANARDAMPKGGTITVETSRVNVGPNFARPKVSKQEALYGAELLTMPQGDYVRLMVRDTGTGIDESTRAMIFMPYFTTKTVEKGVGLGLAAVYSIVKQSGGWLSVESELGQGSRFEVYLPEIASQGPA
jgi:two-component system, cell cycle sensor histidine kinase and response regulator CckA